MTTKRSRASRMVKLQLLLENGNRCAICGRKIKSVSDLAIDHIVPLAEGGVDVIDNYQLAHKACNEAKGNLMPKEFVRQLRYNRRRIRMMRLRKGIVVW